jgi:hypothetical protein
MRRLGAVSLVVAASLAAAPSAGAATVLHLDGVGPLRLGMTRTAALATGWLANRAPGCELASPRPITYRLTGRRAPSGIRGVAQFDGGRLTNLSFTRGVRTVAGVTVGRTTTARMVARYRALGFRATARFVPTFAGTFVTVRRRGDDVSARSRRDASSQRSRSPPCRSASSRTGGGRAVDRGARRCAWSSGRTSGGASSSEPQRSP